MDQPAEWIHNQVLLKVAKSKVEEVLSKGSSRGN
jgi:hypothetical protein